MSQAQEGGGVSPGILSFMLLLAGGVAGYGQDPLKTLPENYRMVFENASVEVIRAHYGPHETVPVHDHPSVATVFVYLNDSGAVRINHQEEGGAPETVVRPPTKLGSYRVAPGLAERHSIENPGGDELGVPARGVEAGNVRDQGAVSGEGSGGAAEG